MLKKRSINTQVSTTKLPN